MMLLATMLNKMNQTTTPQTEHHESVVASTTPTAREQHVAMLSEEFNTGGFAVTADDEDGHYARFKRYAKRVYHTCFPCF